MRTYNVNNHPVNEVYHLADQNQTSKMPEKAKDLVQKVAHDQEEDKQILNEKFESQHHKKSKEKNNV